MSERTATSWAAFALAAFLAIAPEDQWASLRLGLTIVLAPLAAFVGMNQAAQRVGSLLEGRWSQGFGVAVARLLAAVGAGAAALLFDRLAPLGQSAFAALLGFEALTSLAWRRGPWGSTPPPFGDTRSRIDDWIFRGVWLAFAIAVATAATVGLLGNLVTASLILLFGTLGLYFALQTVGLLFSGHQFLVEGSWGGLGGGLGGWRVSRPVVFLTLATFFAGATTVLVLSAVGAWAPSAPPPLASAATDQPTGAEPGPAEEPTPSPTPDEAASAAADGEE
jgi:hypothetical protein